MPVEQVLLATPRGFCAGVEMAIKALGWMLRVFGPPVYCFHEIVHNRHVVRAFEHAGVVFVDSPDDAPPGVPLMLSAHGSSPQVVAKAYENGRFVVDAACPLVTKVHHGVRTRVRKGYRVLYVGHAGHDEAVGTLAQVPAAEITLVQSPADLAAIPADGTPTALLAQTTLGHFEWADILHDAQAKFDGLWTAASEDICYATTNRQRAVQALAGKVDLLVVVGSENSSNTLALERVAQRSGCPRTVRVNSAVELTPALVEDATVVGLTAGASAPERLVDEIIDVLDPRDGVTLVNVGDEDEYFPPPRELRDLIRALDAVVALCLGADPAAAVALGGSFTHDRPRHAAEELAAL